MSTNIPLISHPCAVCCQPTSMWCSRCQNAWYCSPEHLNSVCATLRLMTLALTLISLLRTGRVTDVSVCRQLRRINSTMSLPRRRRPNLNLSLCPLFYLLPKKVGITSTLPVTFFSDFFPQNRAPSNNHHQLSAYTNTRAGYLSHSTRVTILSRRPDWQCCVDTRSQRRAPKVPAASLVLSNCFVLQYAYQSGHLSHNIWRCSKSLVWTSHRAEI